MTQKGDSTDAVSQGDAPPTAAESIRNSTTGRTSLGLFLASVATVIALFTLDAIEFISTGHESELFLAIAKVAGSATMAGMAGMIGTIVWKGRSNGK